MAENSIKENVIGELIRKRKEKLSEKTNEQLIMLGLSTLIPCNVNANTKALKLLLWERSGEKES